MWLVDVAKFRPPHFLVAVSNPVTNARLYECMSPWCIAHARMHMVITFESAA